MDNLELAEIKEYILEKNKEYRRNILLYLKWVDDDFYNRNNIHHSVLSKAFNDIDSFYIEGIKTKKEWTRINKRGKNDFLIEHQSVKKSEEYQSGHFIVLRLSHEELKTFINSFNKE
ncbi:MAG: hypothetical protein Q9M40_07815 [Sulfurimonas sp.]|nr:hypothetical protein [Sulfurimonas sp.]